VNPCSQIDPPKAEPRVVEPPTADQVARILAVIAGQRDEALIVTALATGLRQGELVGLRWMDLEVGDGPVQAPGGVLGDVQRVVPPVRGTHVHVRGQLDRSRRYVGAKRGSERIAALPPVALAAIEAHRHRVTLKASKAPADTAYIFTDAGGRPMTGFEARRRWLVALREAGVPAMPMHATRHFAHSVMEEEGIGGPMIDALFGHRDSRMRARYTHATETARQRAASAMNEALGG
jgi:integrase